MRRETLSGMQNTRKMALKHASDPCFDVFTRNSLFKIALIREILYSHSPLMRAILVNLPQRIAKLQTNVDEPNGRSQANIWPFSAAEKRTFCLILLNLRTRPARSAQNAEKAASQPRPLLPRPLGPCSSKKSPRRNGGQVALVLSRCESLVGGPTAQLAVGAELSLGAG